MGRPVLMGRRTWQSIGRPLPGRTNVVLTHDAGDTEAARQAVHDALRGAGTTGPPEVFVIGGAEVFAQFLPEARRLYLTEIDRVFRQLRFRAVGAWRPGARRLARNRAPATGQRAGLRLRLRRLRAAPGHR